MNVRSGNLLLMTSEERISTVFLDKKGVIQYRYPLKFLGAV